MGNDILSSEGVKKITLNYGSLKIDINLIFQNQKHLSITVHPDKTVMVKAPSSKPFKKIQEHLKKRAAWIIRQLDYFDQFHPLPIEKKFSSGETHYYLGRQYRLKVTKDYKTTVKLMGRFFYVNVPDPKDNMKVKKSMLEWYKYHAKNLLKKRLDMYLNRFLESGMAKPQIIFRRMQKRWGSCSKNKKILINTELIKAPIHCIDYVLVHELCHLIHPNHDKKFFSLLEKILPDWQKRKTRLEKVIL